MFPLALSCKPSTVFPFSMVAMLGRDPQRKASRQLRPGVHTETSPKCPGLMRTGSSPVPPGWVAETLQISPRKPDQATSKWSSSSSPGDFGVAFPTL